MGHSISALALGLLGGFLALLFSAVSAYPNFDYGSDYWCQLLNEQNQKSATLMKWGFVLLAGCLLGFWPAAARLTPARMRLWIVTLGWASALSIPWLAFHSYESKHWTHSLILFAAGGFGLIAALLAIIGGWRNRCVGKIHRTACVALLLAGFANMALYVDLVQRGHPESQALPIVQKVATLAFVVWIVTTLHTDRKRGLRS